MSIPTRGIGNHFRNEAEEIKQLMEECMPDFPCVTDENGNWMTKQQCLDDMDTNGWKRLAKMSGWNDSDIERMK